MYFIYREHRKGNGQENETEVGFDGAASQTARGYAQMLLGITLQHRNHRTKQLKVIFPTNLQRSQSRT